jgi:hypothetical protein
MIQRSSPAFREQTPRRFEAGVTASRNDRRRAEENQSNHQRTGDFLGPFERMMEKVPTNDRDKDDGDVDREDCGG